jgi:hypothetical protein
MKSQISRLSPHQNGKVFGVLLAVWALVLGVPFFTFIFFMGLSVDDEAKVRFFNFPLFVPYIFAIVYLIFGYLSVLIACTIYNLLYKYMGGFEFEQKDKDA